MGSEVSRFAHDDLLPVRATDYGSPGGPEHEGPAPAPAPKLKCFQGLSADYYMRKQHFGSGTFGRAYACLDEFGVAWSIKEVRLTEPRSASKKAFLADERAGLERRPTRQTSIGSDFKMEVRALAACGLTQSPAECFTNMKGSRAYMVQPIMSGSGEDLMGSGGRPGQLAQAIEQVRGARPMRPSAMFRHVLGTLAACTARVHAAHWVLSDIKPANTLYDKGTFEVSDFGLITRAGAPWRGGTRLYWAPETQTDALAHPAMDVYALGVTLAEWVLGEHPFESATRTFSSAACLAYLQGTATRAESAHFGRMFKRLRVIDADLCRLLQTMLGPAAERPTMGAIANAQEITLLPQERAILAEAWRALPRYSPRVLQDLRDTENAVLALRLPYPRKNKIWQT